MENSGSSPARFSVYLKSKDAKMLASLASHYRMSKNEIVLQALRMYHAATDFESSGSIALPSSVDSDMIASLVSRLEEIEKKSLALR